jgi:ABC-type glycerol-3-phosphate transport system substrate-binding protein
MNRNDMLIKQQRHSVWVGWILFCLGLLLMLSACQAEEGAQGDIMVWHSWPEGDTAVLEQIIANYQAINPRATILSQHHPPDQLLSRYSTAVANGLGPDVVILPSRHLMPLAAEQLIAPLNPEQINRDRYFRPALEAVMSGDQIYGIPLTLEPWVLFYNSQQVSQPANDLETLLAHANAGQQVGFNSSFEGVFWGIQAFGGQLLNDDGTVNLSSGSLANWLRWLQRAQTSPGIIISRDADALSDLFAQGSAAYLIAPATQYPALVAQMGAEQVAIAQLPQGPLGAAGSLLQVQSLLFNPHSSAGQRAVALDWAQFLTNTEQSRLLMRLTGRAPANRNVQVLATAYPVVAAVTNQSRTAVSTRYKQTLAELLPVGDRILAEMLEGTLDPSQALPEFATALGDRVLVTAVGDQLPDCPAPSQLTLTHGWQGSAADWLEGQIASYQQACPNNVIRLNPINPTTLRNFYQAQLRAQTASELLLGPDDWLVSLADAGHIAPLPAPIMEPQLWQRFYAVAQATARYGEPYYAVPLALELHTLFYNEARLSDPPQQVDDLLTGATASNPAVLPLEFQALYWGLEGFGGSPLQADGSFVLDETGLVPWLSWLAAHRTDPRLSFRDPVEGGAVSASFATGQALLDVAWAGELAGLQAEEALAGQLGIASLPAGGVAASRPWVSSQVLYVRPEVAEAELAAIRHLVAFLTATEAQTALLLATPYLPVSIQVTAPSDPARTKLLAQIDTAVVPPRSPELDSFIELGGMMYYEVVREGVDPTAVACQLARQMNQRHDHTIPPSTYCR